MINYLNVQQSKLVITLRGVSYYVRWPLLHSRVVRFVCLADLCLCVFTANSTCGVYAKPPSYVIRNVTSFSLERADI